jgi:hypothetical protein
MLEILLVNAFEALITNAEALSRGVRQEGTDAHQLDAPVKQGECARDKLFQYAASSIAGRI